MVWPKGPVQTTAIDVKLMVRVNVKKYLELQEMGMEQQKGHVLMIATNVLMMDHAVYVEYLIVVAVPPTPTYVQMGNVNAGLLMPFVTLLPHPQNHYV